MGPLWSKIAGIKLHLVGAEGDFDSHSSEDDVEENNCNWEDALTQSHSQLNSKARADSEVARKYQSELVEKAKTQNLIICLPTGSGKTFIALELTKYYLAKAVEENKKIVFLANTIQLVLQQAEYFKKNLEASSDVDHVATFIGSKGMDSWTKEKWKAKIESCNVMIMISKVFYNIVNRHITMGDVCLLIFDECHHANQCHDMRQVMNSYFTIKKANPSYPLPRILGLTATLISDNGKTGNVEQYVQSMEANLDCKAITYHDYEQVLKHSTNAKIKYLIYNKDKFEQSDGIKVLEQGKEDIKFCLKEIENDVNTKEANSKVIAYGKELLNSIDDIYTIHRELGQFCAILAAQHKLSSISTKPLNETDERLLCLVSITIGTLKSYLNPPLIARTGLDDCTIKVGKLLDELKGWIERRSDELCGIVFVERRTTALTLTSFLKKWIKSKPVEFGFLKPGFVVGANRGVEGLGELMGLQRYQKEVVDKFYNKEYNLLFCTSILEEGLNIPSCNVIFRFDGLTSYRSFIQSMGRARDQNAEFIVFVPAESFEAERKQIEEFQQFNVQLSEYLREKALRLDFESQPDTVKCSPSSTSDLSFCPGGTIDSPTITMRTAVGLVYQYCQLLAIDKQSVPEPIVTWKEIHGLYPNPNPTEKDKKAFAPGIRFQATVTLPTYALWKEETIGPIMPNKKLAKQAAFLEIIKKLYALGAITELLLPKRTLTLDKTMEKYIELDANFMLGEAVKGIRSTQQGKFSNWFYKKTPNYLKDALVEPGTKLFVYQILLKLADPRGVEKEDIYRFENKQFSYGIVLSKGLDFIPKFDLITSAGFLSCTLKNLTNEMNLILSDIQIKSLLAYQRELFFNVLQLNLRLAELREKVEYLVVPLVQDEDQAFSISWTSVENIYALQNIPESYTQRPSLTEISEMSFEDCESRYEDALVIPWYIKDSGNPFHAVSKIVLDKSPLDPFDKTERAPNFIEYFDRKHGIKIQHANQPMFRCTRLTKNLNFFSKTFVHQICLSQDPTRKCTDKSMITLFPELVRIFPYSGTLLAQSRFIPSVLHRIERLLIAEEVQVGLAEASGWTGALLREEKPATLTYADYCLNYDPEVKRKIMESMERGALALQEMNPLTIKFLERKPMSNPLKNLTEAPISQVESKMKKRAGLNFGPLHKSSLDKTTHPGPSLFTIMEALTVAGANDCFNLEKLETIGDSFLKYCATMHICTHFPEFDEGKMSRLRTKIVSNSSLNNIGSQFGLGELMSGAYFYPDHTFLPRAFKLPEKFVEVVVKLDGNLDLFDQYSSKELKEMNVDQLLDIGKERMKQGLSTVTPKARLLSYSKLREKDISDCIEALIGAYYTNGGQEAALLFMNYIGIQAPVGRNAFEPFGKWDIKESELQGDVKFRHTPEVFFPKIKEFQQFIGYNFNNEWNLVEAFTHSSYYTKNRITPSYERLEFLGDAVLDFLVTDHIHKRCNLTTPGQLTDVRSALVNNITLGSLAVRSKFQKYLIHASPFLENAISSFVSLQERFKDDAGIGQFELVENKEGILTAVDVQTPKVLGDLYESLAGALFVDSKGNLDQVWKVLYPLMKSSIDKYTADIPITPLRQIYEWNPNCVKVSKADGNHTGPFRNKPVATITMLEQTFRGTGNSEKSAKEAAAKYCIRELKSQFPGFKGPADYLKREAADSKSMCSD